MLSHLGQPVISKEIAATTLAHFSANRGNQSSESVLPVALETLRSRGLLELQDDDIHLHSLTLRLFRPVAERYRGAVYKSAIEAYLAKRVISDNGTIIALNPKSLPWSGALYWIASQIDPDELNRWPPDMANVMLSDLRWGLSQ